MGIITVYIGYRFMYYPKFYCELNQIEYFWCNEKN